MPTSGTLSGWRLTRAERKTWVRIDGPLVLNAIDLIRLSTDTARPIYNLIRSKPHNTGRLTRVLNKFTPHLPGYHLYYPHSRHASTAFTLFVDMLRYRA